MTPKSSCPLSRAAGRPDAEIQLGGRFTYESVFKDQAAVDLRRAGLLLVPATFVVGGGVSIRRLQTCQTIFSLAEETCVASPPSGRCRRRGRRVLASDFWLGREFERPCEFSDLPSPAGAEVVGVRSRLGVGPVKGGIEDAGALGTGRHGLGLLYVLPRVRSRGDEGGRRVRAARRAGARRRASTGDGDAGVRATTRSQAVRRPRACERRGQSVRPLGSSFVLVGRW